MLRFSLSSHSTDDCLESEVQRLEHTIQRAHCQPSTSLLTLDTVEEECHLDQCDGQPDCGPQGVL